MKKKLLSSTLALGLMFGPAMAMAEEEAISIVVNDQPMVLETAPVWEQDRILLPFRELGEKFGAKVNYIEEEQAIVATKGEKTITLVIGDNRICINGETEELEVAPKIANDRAMVPLRAFAQAFGADVQWDAGVVRIAMAENRAMELLLKSTYASLQLESYTFEGQINMQTTVTGLPEEVDPAMNASLNNMDMNIATLGYFEKPDKYYVVNTVFMPELEEMPPDMPESISTEVYSDGNYLYMNMSFLGEAMGLEESDQWFRSEAYSEAYKELAKNSQDPVTAVEQMVQMGIEPIALEEKVINGQKYYVIQFTFTEKEYSFIAENNYPFTNVTPQGQEEMQRFLENLQLTITYNYYINADTYVSDLFDFSGIQKIEAEPGVIVEQTFKGSAVMKNLNEPVTFPDVSGAIEMPAELAQF
ncbi:copper amine oxidase N-terminal domain-containing protein [Heliorestis acidaminivorans]|uniref:Copper amine oxidase N-terminal domain-containing protein n=1 Tax=Heliorestis acidaminivorans TaxID=553427 RepID=A0A6I0EVT1_9FIRM|nr:copper amine oxidase N-terminal domain-containing protein [Heliorestis acidaminivorans]KAB2952078.1 copper amine oxidase N-terminal domain-containing protein [Heliorestis acidaminivorans]